MNVAAYIHIPFCARKCLYCDFTSCAGKEDLHQPYVAAVRAEIRRAAARFPGTGISTIYFGGGTPNLLSAQQLGGILDEVRRGFKVDEDAEVSTEANPGVTSGGGDAARGRHGEEELPTLNTQRSTLNDLRDAGFNRLSLGVQSFNDDELRLLGRIHTADEAVYEIDAARLAGFDNLNIDLMYAIPGQTLESWQDTLRQAIDLGPEHVSLYSLTVEEGTPFHAMQVEGKLSLPSSDTEADMYEDAIGMLTDAGFVHYEISNFALPGRECRHNLTYWRNEPYFGFGAGATGFLPAAGESGKAKVERGQMGPAAKPLTQHETRSTNVPSVEDYIRLIDADESPVESQERLVDRAAMGETMFLGLRMLDGVDVPAFLRRYGVLPQEIFASQIADLTARGLIIATLLRVRLTETGLFLGNDVFAEFVG